MQNILKIDGIELMLPETDRVLLYYVMIKHNVHVWRADFYCSNMEKQDVSNFRKDGFLVQIWIIFSSSIVSSFRFNTAEYFTLSNVPNFEVIGVRWY